jgi:hypothetical protein
MTGPSRPLSLLGCVTLALSLTLPAVTRAAELAAGTTRIAREQHRLYRSLPLAVAAAVDGDVVELGPGTFEGAIVIAGKALRLRGAGAGRTVLTADGTVLQVAADGRAHVVGLSLVARGGGSFAPAVLAAGDGFRLEECIVEGASGFGVELRDGRHDVEVFGVTIRGNGGGGIRLGGAVGRIHGNVIVDNGGPGLLLEGEPSGGALVRAEHNTIVRNLVHGEAITATVAGGPDAPVPDALRGLLLFDWNVASGRLAAGLLAADSAARLQQRNVLLWPDRLGDAFEDVDGGDYRPEDAFPTDPLGLEMGALLSEDGRERLVPAIDTALAEGRLGDALTLARRTAPEQRETLWERIRTTLYAGYVKHVDAGHLGLTVRDFFLAMPGAPAGWNVRDRFDQAIDRIRQSYATTADWSAAFTDALELRGVLAELLGGGQLRPGRPAIGPPGTGWLVSARTMKTLLLDRHKEPLEQTLTLDNPQYAGVRSTLDIETSRRTRMDEQRRRVAEEVAAYEARGGAATKSAFVAAKRRELDRLSHSLVEADDRLRKLEQTLAQVPQTYTVTVKGHIERLAAMGEVSLQLTDSLGKHHDRTIPFRREDAFLSLEPIPLLGFDGIPARPVADDREHARFTKEFAERALIEAIGIMEAHDLLRLGELAQAAGADKASEEDRNELFALLVVYADRLRDAIAAERPAAELRFARERYPDIDRPRFQLAYDATLTRKPPLEFTVETSAARRQAERLLEGLELRFAPYWRVLGDLRTEFDRLGGLPLEEFLRLSAAGGTM